jgi:two-component system, OmpR family, phosphate regulon sensor histidine kinase PhoR
MNANDFENLIAKLAQMVRYHALVAWRTKDFWVRALLCWMVGAVLLTNDEASNFDVRLQIRGQRPSTGRVVVINIRERDWSNLVASDEFLHNPNGLSATKNVIRPLKEISTVNDSFFWNSSLWEHLLRNVLAASPKAVGVTFFFGDNIRWPQASASALSVFADQRIVWAAEHDNSGRILVPLFASTYNTNVGLRDMRRDDDGNVRRFTSSSIQIPHFGVKLAAAAAPDSAEEIFRQYDSPTLINYSGDSDSFKVYNAKDIFEGKFEPQDFKDRVVVIGSLETPLEQLQTPMGRMSRSEVIANVTDQVLTGATISRMRPTFYLALLAILMIGAIWILVSYPQSVTLVVFVLAAIIWSAASAWAFDVMYFWVPVFSPLAQLTVTCIVFLSYQLSLNERKTWRLQQEQIYLQEIEHLKSNFVSMMSHDLKTPIAKIQAICDRLIASAQESELTQDLRNLRRSSDELHRYIQSILQVSRVEAKDFKIQKEVMDINESIEKVYSRLQPLAAEKNLTIEKRLEPMFSIEADTTLIQEVIHNLIENAIKYTPARAASEPSGKIIITSQEKDDNVVVVVEDTGPGIDPRDQKEIWQKFTRGQHQMSAGPEVRGTGLGLYLVKYFIELHGGKVFLNSAPGVGTKIGFSIPIMDDTDSSIQPSI